MGLKDWFTRRSSASQLDRSPWGDFWFTSLAGLSGTGVHVTADSALRLSAVYSCVRVLSESMAVLPFRLYRPKVGGGRSMVRDHWLFRLMARQPNRFQTPFEWREMLQGHLALRGNAFCRIVDDGSGGVAELLPLHPDRMRVEMLDNGSWRYRYNDPVGGSELLRRDQVWHLRGLSSDGVMGLSPIELQREAIAGGLSAQAYGNRFFANDAKPSGGWIEFPGKFATREDRATFRESWQQMQGGANRGKVAVLEQGMKFHEIGINNRDSQFLESRQFTVGDVARIFRVPPHLIGDLSKATFSNIEQQSLEFVTHTMTPWAERWESSLETFLLGPDSDLEAEFDFAVLLRGDAAGRSSYYHNGILDGWLTRNEARAREGLDPIEGLDEPLRPLNMVEEHQAGDEMLEADGGADDAVQPTDDGVAVDASRLAHLLRGNAERMARRIAMQNPPSADVLADALAITPEAAQRYLDAQLGVELPVALIVADLVRLARGASSAMPAVDVALTALATAIAQQPAPVVNVTVPERSVALTAPIHIDAHVDAARPVVKTIVTQRKDDGTLVATVSETEADRS